MKYIKVIKSLPSALFKLKTQVLWVATDKTALVKYISFQIRWYFSL